MSRISFAPLEPDAVAFLTARTGIEYRHCDFAGPQWFCCTARDDGKILGVFVGEFQLWFECHISCAIDHPRFMSRRLLRAIFTTLFSQAVRLTALVRPENEKAIRIIRHLGFQYEGYLRMGVEGKWDGLMFGMLRNECRWLVRDMRPTLPKFDLTDSHLVNTKTGGDLRLRANSGANSANLISRQLGVQVALAALVMGVVLPFSDIVLSARPAQMAWIDAGANSATMGSISVPIGMTMDGGADKAMNFPCRAFSPHLGIAASIHRKRPDKAVIALIGNGVKEGVIRRHPLNIQEV